MRVMFLVSWVWVLTWVGTTSERAGTRRTSSKVKASGRGKVNIRSILMLPAPFSSVWVGRSFWLL